MDATSPTMPRRALLSVSDKTGLVDLGEALARHRIDILSSGGTAAALREAGLAVTEVSALTGFPEMLDGRVKTLHPKIHGGLLGRRDFAAHRDAMAAHDIQPIDLLVVDLYPFEAALAAGADAATLIEKIDIGGPAMIRSAAKNHADVAVVVRTEDYAQVVAALDAGGFDAGLRRRLAAIAFARTAAYDAAIAGWMTGWAGVATPPFAAFGGPLIQSLRYGENPHQTAAFYRVGEPRPGVATARMLQGKELSYNNINDTDAAFELVAEFATTAVVLVKHASPCGVALGETVAGAFARALAADPVSAFGGIVASNRPIDGAAAHAIADLFAEVVIAPAVTAEARAILAERKALRVLETGALPDPAASPPTVRSVAGGLLVQGRDGAAPNAAGLAVVTRRQPTPAEIDDLLFAARVVKHVKSNAIVLARGGMTVGIGGGQTSRVDAARQAVDRAAAFAQEAGEPASRAVGAVVASDAFFPFPDGLDVCLRAGVTAAIHPGGSKRDAEVVAAADARDAAMVVTGLRAFRH